MPLLKILPNEHWASYELRSHLINFGHISSDFLKSILYIRKKPKFPHAFYWDPVPKSVDTEFFKLYKNIALNNHYRDRSFDLEHTDFVEIYLSGMRCPATRIDILELISGKSKKSICVNGYPRSHNNPITYHPASILEDIKEHGVSYFRKEVDKDENRTAFMGCALCDSIINRNSFNKDYSSSSIKLGNNSLTPSIRILDTLKNLCRYCKSQPSNFSLEYEYFLTKYFGWNPYE